MTTANIHLIESMEEADLRQYLVDNQFNKQELREIIYLLVEHNRYNKNRADENYQRYLNK